jgi:phosphoribosylaminoimidazole-succinocarboxamide synthase
MASTIDPSTTTLFESSLNLPGLRRGKVRDVYDMPGGTGPDRLLIVASDRMSAFDVVLPTPIPGKGVLLTGIAAWWLRFIERNGLSRTHLISTDAADVPDEALTDATTRHHLAGRVTIGRRCRVIPVECVVRGYIEGSGWRDYQRTGAICGVSLPAGLRQCDRLPEPIFTPATKAEQGEHDENISFEQACELVGTGLMETLRERSLAIYTAAAEHALSRGIIIADTKFEFGLASDDDDPILIDEALTPDSSRFWPADQYEPGRSQPSFDKQFLREHLQELVDHGQWDKTAPGPELPEHVVTGTLDRYREARDRLIAE